MFILSRNISLIFLRRACIQIIQRTSERGDPWGSPAETSLIRYMNPSITSCAIQFKRNEDIHLTRFQGRPTSIRIWIRISWATQLQAPLTSMKIAPVMFPFFQAFLIKLISFRRVSYVFQFFYEPYWPSQKMWRFSQKEVTFFTTTLSITFLRYSRSEITLYTLEIVQLGLPAFYRITPLAIFHMVGQYLS